VVQKQVGRHLRENISDVEDGKWSGIECRPG